MVHRLHRVLLLIVENVVWSSLSSLLSCSASCALLPTYGMMLLDCGAKFTVIFLVQVPLR